MSRRRLRVLTISDLFPDPVRPALGIFVAHQVRHLQALCDQVVVVPLRVFPHLRRVRRVRSLQQLALEWQDFREELLRVPASNKVDGSAVYYWRYSSLPKQLGVGTWGIFAYAFVQGRLRALHAQQRFDLVHAHYACPAGVVALLAQRWLQIPIVLSIHGSDVTHTVKQGPLSAAIIRWVLRRVDAVIVNSAWTAERVRRLGVAPDKIDIVHLGAEPPAQAPKTASSQPFSWFTVAYLEHRKGHALVLRALHTLRALGYDFRYRSVGDGPCREELIALSEQLGLSDRVSFESTKPQAELWQHYAACDGFVLPSSDEAFGLAYIEALSCGKPVIGCESEGGPEELRALGDCIELVSAHTVDSLVGAMRRLMEEPARRRELAETGREIVRRHFNWSRTAAQTLAVYERVLAQAPRFGRGYADPARYWEQRLAHSFDLRGAGYATLGASFNTALYAARRTALDRALAATGGGVAGLRVLEVGCGTGFYTEFCHSQAVAAYTGVDLTQVSVSRLASHYPDFQFVRAELGTDSFALDAQFDVVLVADVLFHVVDAARFQRALEQLTRCVSPGGRLIISDVFPALAERSAEHVQLRSRTAYETALSRQRMQVAHVQPIFAVLQPPVSLATAAVPWRMYAQLWQHVLMRAARRRTVDRNLPHVLAWLDRHVFLRRVGLSAPNTKWLVARFRAESAPTTD